MPHNTTEDDEAVQEAVRRLHAAAPHEKASLLLRFIEENSQNGIRLSDRNGLRTTLDGIDLNREALAGRADSSGELHAWWDPKQQGVNLEKADLEGVSLRDANLHGANLREANLRNTILAGTDLRGAILERANLSGADLAGTNFEGAVLSGADFEGAMLEDAAFANATLRFAKFQDCVLETVNLQNADLWSANLERADLTRANLQGTTLVEARLAGANLEEANLRNAELGGADLKGANLRGAQLMGATLRNANLAEASLKEAELEKVDLSHCNIRHVRLSGAGLEKTRFRLDQLGGAIGEELSGEYEEARLGYLAVERNLGERGDTEAESWAYRKRRRMGKCESLARARDAWAEHQWRKSFSHYAGYLNALFVEWTCDYGESIGRVLWTIFALWMVFALIYGLTGSVVNVANTNQGITRKPDYDPLDIAVFSLIAMTTTGSPPYGMEPLNEFVQLVAGIEGLLAIALTGLLGFVTGNRIRR